MAPVEPAEALLAGVAKQAITFCADKDGNGVIELKEGCLAVGGAWEGMEEGCLLAELAVVLI
jgi:hypothetical protein